MKDDATAECIFELALLFQHLIDFHEASSEASSKDIEANAQLAMFGQFSLRCTAYDQTFCLPVALYGSPPLSARSKW